MHPMLTALYSERIEYLRVETQLKNQLRALQRYISTKIHKVQGVSSELESFQICIEELSIIWDALIECNNQIRVMQSTLRKRDREPCPLCNVAKCNLCIPF